jgi:hypothetical protein
MFVKFQIKKITLLRRNISFFRKKNTTTQLVIHPGYAQISNGEKLTFKDMELDEDFTFIKLDRNGKTYLNQANLKFFKTTMKHWV